MKSLRRKSYQKKTGLDLLVTSGMQLPRKNEAGLRLDFIANEEDKQKIREALHKFLSMVIIPERKKDNEISAKLLSQQEDVVGENKIINSEFLELQNDLIAKEIEKGKTKANATAYVSENYIGLRISNPIVCLHLTPNGLKKYNEWVKRPGGRLEFPNVKPNEISAVFLSKQESVIGDNRIINSEFLELQNDLIAKEIAKGKTEGDAAAYVSENYVGMRKPKTNVPCLYLTPKGLVKYNKWIRRPGGRLEFSLIKEFEISVRSLCNHDNITGQHRTINFEFVKLREELISCIYQGGRNRLDFSLEEAIKIVDEKLIGNRKSVRSHNKSLHTTPDGLRVYIRENPHRLKEGDSENFDSKKFVEEYLKEIAAKKAKPKGRAD